MPGIGGNPFGNLTGAASALSPIGAGLDILGGLFGSTTNSTYGQTPTYDPTTEGLRQQLIKAQQANLSTDTDLSGYTSQGLQTINQGYDAASKALQQTLASRGLTYSPISGSSTAALGTQRIGAGIQFQNQIPLLRQQLYQQKLASALQTFAAQPYSVSGQQTQSGGGLLSGVL
jgi:hypothetical protein